MGVFSPNILGNSFISCAKYNADHEVIVFGDRRITWKELTPRIFKIANALIKTGVKKDDKVAFMFHNTPEFVEINMGIQAAGAIPVPVNYRFTSNEVEYQVNHSDSIVLFYDSIWEDTVKPVADKMPKVIDFICKGESGFERAIDFDEFVSSGEESDPEIGNNWDDVAVMIYTGGTTGFPKGVMLTYGAHRDMFALLGASFVIRFLSQDMTKERKDFLLKAFAIPGSKVISIFQGTKSFKKILNRPGVFDYFNKTIHKRFSDPLVARKADKNVTRAMFPSTPFFHDASYSQLIMGAFLGSYTYILLDSVKFDPELVFKTIEKEKVMNITNVPTGWKKLVSFPEADKYDLGSVRLATTGGGLCSSSLKGEIFKLMPNAMLMDSFGQTEMTPMTSFKIDIDADNLKEKCVGKSIIKTRIIDESGNDVAPGEIGEILYNSSTIMKGYYKEDDKNKDIMKDGWFKSGDLGFFDENGEIRIVDRKNECINTGGEKVFPGEVEEIVCKHPQIEDACVIGVPDEEWGKSIRAVLAVKEGESADTDDIIKFCRGKMAGYKIPRSIIFVDHLPYSSAGKLLRQKVRDLYSNSKEKQVTK